MMAAMDVGLLRSYELARSQLNYSAAWNLITAFSISPRWLATGGGPMLGRVKIPKETALGIGPRTLFIEVYDRGLLQSPAEPESIFGQQQNNRLSLWLAVKEELKNCVAQLPDGELTAFYGKLRTFLEREVPDTPIEDADLVLNRLLGLEVLSAPEESQTQGLTNVTESEKQSAVKRQLPSLLDRLKKATQERGSKTVLAKHLGVPLANVSQWLSGEREPGGETTLRLLNWVQQQERPKT